VMLALRKLHSKEFQKKLKAEQAKK
ncbi:uncharacterized protein METZ01_LOCUS350436, partial [marine metagenome]